MDAREELKKGAKKASGFINEFKVFISRGNVIDLAVGVIIGGAFGKIVSSLVDNIIMPLIGIIMGGVDFSALTIKFANVQIGYGIFIQNIIDFLIIAACIFVFVKIINGVNTKAKNETEVVDKKELKKDDELLVVLKEIRDSIKQEHK